MSVTNQNALHLIGYSPFQVKWRGAISLSRFNFIDLMVYMLSHGEYVIMSIKNFK
jgi:hypothetical protein